MADLIQLLQEVQQERQTHLFCPRATEGESDRYDEDEGDLDKVEDADRRAKIERTRTRRQNFMDSLHLLAYDGVECQPYHAQIYDMLDTALKGCEVCVRRYHLARMDFEAKLRQEYQEAEVNEFISILNRRDVARIRDGLTGAKDTLQNLPETKRTIRNLHFSDLVALFESLHSSAFLNDEKLLEEYFDIPFKLVQTKKHLKLDEIVPAATKFLFDPNPTRLTWAVWVWNRVSRPPTDIEWEYAIRQTLQHRYQSSNDPRSSTRLWSGLKVISRQLTKEQITHKLFDLNPPFSRLALDHLAQPTFSVPQIVHTLTEIFKKAPESFWQIMGSISSSTLVESVFGSPNFDKCLEASVNAKPEDGLDVLSWTIPFLESMPPSNRPAACHTLVFQLFQRVHADKMSKKAKALCFSTAIKVMQFTLSGFSDSEADRKSTARLVLSDTLNIVSTYIDELLKPKIDLEEHDIRADVMRIVRNAIALECQCLKADFEALMSGQLLGHDKSSYSPDIWDSVIANLHEDDTPLSQAVISGIAAFPGLDEFRLVASPPTEDLKASEKQFRARYREQQLGFNMIYEKVTNMIGTMLGRLSEFKPDHLDTLFRAQNTSMILIACLFSADSTIYQSTVELIKNISGEQGRKEALAHLLQAFFSVTLYGIDWAFRRIATMRTFASIPRMLKTGMEILEVLCDSTGLLRIQKIEGSDLLALRSYWSYQWLALRGVFRHTERWSTEVHDRVLMTDVCRDTMQYARELFKHYHLFLNVLQHGDEEKGAEISQVLLVTDEASPICSPPKALEAMSKWLRLRDDYLADTLVRLITGMLARLKEYGSTLSENNLQYVINVVAKHHSEKSYVKTILGAQQKAELIRALENYLGKPVIKHPEAKKQSTLKGWTVAGDRSGSSTPVSSAIDADDFADEEIKDEDLYQLSEHHEKIQKDKAARDKLKGTPRQSLPSRPTPHTSAQLLAARKAAESKAFIENRKREQEARKARDRDAALRLRGKSGVGEQTAEAGSGLAGIGVKGKDHSIGKSELMVSSDSESDSSEDDELFGKIRNPTSSAIVGTKQITKAGPVRKIKQVRSQKDIRARLTPDLSALHKVILGWDFFADTDTPPNSSKTDYTLVTNTFKSAAEYVKTFEPLLVLEGWQSFRAAREEGNFQVFEIKVANSLIVDNFVEINTVMPMSESKDLGLNVTDVVLLSKGNRPADQKDMPHCLARVKEITRKRGEVQIVYRVNAAQNSLRSSLHDKAVIYAVQILSLTPLEREYSALLALEYYDLCDEIIRAKPSPLLEYAESDLTKIKHTYNVNTAQAKAVKSAIDNDAFTLIQGPPGSGKTKTICAIVGAILTGFTKKPANNSRGPDSNGSLKPPPATKKILVCAPSNAAVDELVMRFKDGVKLMDGSAEKISVVRLGRSEAINAAVKDVTLEELVSARLNTTAPGTDERDDIHSVMMEHKSVCDELNQHRAKMDDLRRQGAVPSNEDESLLDGLKRKKGTLGSKIDDMRERKNAASRDAELSRRRAQQMILDDAHVLCATLSGSGHELFQSLNVEFETVVIDEAAQSIELSALIPLKYGCSKCILVGDPKQLPPTVLSRQAAKFQYEQSLFARMENNHKKDVHLLDTQYRMHPEISVFPSRMFYDSRLKDGDGMAKLRARPWHQSEVLGPYRFFDVQGTSQTASKGHSFVNTAEITVAMSLYDRLITDVTKYDFAGKIGIITPYKGQLKELKNRFRNRYGESILSAIEFNTTDAFQGRESEIIIFSCVRAATNGLGFLNDIRRMNVGLTRAKCSLWVLGDCQTLTKGEYWRGLVEDAKSRKLYTNGDINAMLRRPLLTADMMRDDVIMEDAESPQTEASPATSSSTKQSSNEASSDKWHSATGRPTDTMSRKSSTSSVTRTQSIPKQESSLPRIDAKSERKQSQRNGQHSATIGVSVSAKPKETENGRSGGRFGLNPNATCSICGSNAHFSSNCDNQKARETAIGACYRCQKGGHTYASCTEPRCIQCGAVGHLQNDCKASRQQYLSSAAQDDVKRQEVAFGRSQERARDRLAEKRLGDHDPKIPVVKSTATASHLGDGKRKREDGQNMDGLRAAKTSKTSEETGVNGVNHRGSLSGRPLVPSGGVIKKKKPKAEDMFMKKK